jgi:uncharacterized paraquat-inducible protein A
MTPSDRIATAVRMLSAARTLIAGITGSIRDIPAISDRTIADIALTLDTGIAIENLDAVLDDMADAIDILEAYTPDNHPDNNDRDAGRICPTCQHDLELNADFQCTRCGSHA